MATLFLGRRTGVAGFARTVAIKVVHPHLASDPTFVRMFIDEAMLSAKIVHPNVVHVEELGQVRGKYFLAMEYVPGCSLAQLLHALRRRNLALAPDLAVWIASQVADALHAAHETRGDDGELLGVVHRDVSPQNVLLSDQGHVKLIDFGIAKARGRTLESATGTLKGKLRYMAPEQARAGAVDRRTDVFALGIVLWEMLTNRRLFDAVHDLAVLDQVRHPQVEPPSRFAADVPPELDAVVLAALSADPSQRPETALELRCLLADAAPRAHVLAPSQLAALLTATVGDAVAAARTLAQHGLPHRNDTTDSAEHDAERLRALETLTVNVRGATVPDEIDGLDPTAAALELARHAASLPDLRPRGPRWLAAAAGVFAMAGVFALGNAWVRASAPSSLPAGLPAAPPPERAHAAPPEPVAPEPTPAIAPPALATVVVLAPDASATTVRARPRSTTRHEATAQLAVPPHTTPVAPATPANPAVTPPPRDHGVHMVPGTTIPSEFPM